jgi:hypothetical protein
VTKVDRAKVIMKSCNRLGQNRGPIHHPIIMMCHINRLIQFRVLTLLIVLVWYINVDNVQGIYLSCIVKVNFFTSFFNAVYAVLFHVGLLVMLAYLRYKLLKVTSVQHLNTFMYSTHQCHSIIPFINKVIYKLASIYELMCNYERASCFVLISSVE